MIACAELNPWVSNLKKKLTTWPEYEALQSALVGVQSTALEEYDPALPNDYEEYSRERKRKARAAKMMRKLERRRQEEEEEEEREREREGLRRFQIERLRRGEVAAARCHERGIRMGLPLGSRRPVGWALGPAGR
ncbi:hypothetical protein VNO78_12161 [Psophocarpus tetragonolobus]|uniref:Uncharacterized protein n=1 Tax=Psophocarpus tetragonolobus TaxID=3891 RepID=A0AAN9XNR2_PSOTE